MNREEMLRRLHDRGQPWDIVIVGGGATGVGSAVDAASRGYNVLLLEQSDFGKGTSSRSTKLVHGGVRYLQQANVSLVMEALKERGILRENAPHLVHDLAFVVPNYDWWEAPFYGIGLKIYDMLAGRYGFGPSNHLSREKTIERIPTIEAEGLRGGTVYYDGQFDDARLLINLVQTAAEQGATLLNYVEVTGLLKAGDGFIAGVIARDLESGEDLSVAAKAVVNATGAFADTIRRMDNPQAKPMISPSQGVHIVLHKSFLPGDTAVMVPRTDDGRVLFAIPWHDRVLVGTTDTPVDEVPLEPRPLDEEIDFILKHTARYLKKDPAPEDVLSTFAGIRPLVSDGGEGSTAGLSRDHTVHVAGSGLITITGGKWTTYRKMAEDTVDHAATVAQLEDEACVTKQLAIHGFHKQAQKFGDLEHYGSDAPAIDDLIRSDPSYAEKLHPELSVRAGEVIWAVRHEMARTVDDVLARRTRSILLNARAAIEAAPKIAVLMAKELGRDESWQVDQVAAFTTLGRGYLLSGPGDRTTESQAARNGPDANQAGRSSSGGALQP
jgi:glycerol-3-phosphate dehydrogenase